MHSKLVSALCAGAIVAGAFTSTATAAPTVSLKDGVARGTTSAGTEAFLGLPYAAAPVGALRWRAPQPPARWKGVRNATKPAPGCAQPDTPFGVPSVSEDCLYLNVHAPAGHGRDRPVLVWIHGGGLWLGESEDNDPTKLAADGTVVVTINYRLGALGFLAHPAFAGKPGGASGNYGWMDQQAALRWVQRNIATFGGDPDNVTIGGHSAGALSVLAQLASPGARGLFDRAIVQSGAFALSQTPLATAEAEGQAFAAKAGCPNQSATCLRNLPVATVLSNQRAVPTGYTPGVLDGKVLTQSVGTALASGQFNRVPILNGTVHDESREFVAIEELPPSNQPVTAANYQARISAALGVPAGVAAAIAGEYPLSAYPSPAVALSAVETDVVFACPAIKLDEWTSKYVPTFAYEFNDEKAPQRFLPPVSFPYGAWHQAETQYLFDLPTAKFPATLSGPQKALASSMKDYWAAFADRGVPSVSGQPAWPRFPKLLSLETPRPKLETSFAKDHHCGFWAA